MKLELGSSETKRLVEHIRQQPAAGINSFYW